MIDHPITLSPELVNEWLHKPEFAQPGLSNLVTITTNKLNQICADAAQWGAEQELEGLTLDCDNIDVPVWYYGDDVYVYKEGYASGWADATLATDRARWGQPVTQENRND
jgi:hypothetical protein